MNEITRSHIAEKGYVGIQERSGRPQMILDELSSHPEGLQGPAPFSAPIIRTG